MSRTSVLRLPAFNVWKAFLWNRLMLKWRDLRLHMIFG